MNPSSTGAVAVREADVVEADVAPRSGNGRGARRLDDDRLGVEHLDDPPAAATACCTVATRCPSVRSGLTSSAR